MTTPAATELSTFSDALRRLRQGDLRPHAFSDQTRAFAALRAALPARYDEVLLGLLDRLESGALFAEESCSFSQKDLVDSLQMWADKAGGVLAADPA
ncbi:MULTISPECIES: hypothetical protein [unclassified Acidovorax]|uniref:hypothetical protein n=1 Tax=unclassified Acidovorax TaxID=2684926 RepID=UPI002882D6B7|nr:MULTISPECIES: hypothetical protein [unclassified Acidovorax]